MTTLEQATEMFPVGTQIISVYGAKDIVTGQPYAITGNMAIAVNCETGSGRVIYINGNWAKIIPTVIDWRVPTKVEFTGLGRYIVQTLGNSDDKSFSGVVIESNNKEVQEGYYSDSFIKEDFKPFIGVIKV